MNQDLFNTTQVRVDNIDKSSHVKWTEAEENFRSPLSGDKKSD